MSYSFHIGSSEDHLTILYKHLEYSREKLTEAYTPDILHCDDLRDFWVLFDVEGKLEFGRGLVLENPILSYTDHNPSPVHAISLKSTKLAREPADWEFYKSQGGNHDCSVFYLRLYFAGLGPVHMTCVI